MELLSLQYQINSYNLSFEQNKNKNELNKEGQYPTPNDMAMDITKHTLRYLEGYSNISFLEPAFGTGSFYLALLQSTDKSIVNSYGIEKDYDLSSFASNIWSQKEIQIVNEDFTNWDSNEKFNLLITNPPYVRHHHLSADYKKELQMKALIETGYKVSGYAGLHIYFMLLSHKYLEKGAISTWLIPAEFMSVNYGEAIRDYLTGLVTLKQIHQYNVEISKFENALVTSSVVIFANELPQEEQEVILSYGGNMSNPERVSKVSLKELSQANKWTSHFNQSKNNFRQSNDDSSFSLGDFFNIRRGIATGNNKFFILPLSKAKKLNISRECYKFVLPSPSKIPSKIIETRVDGEPIIDDVLVVIDTGLNMSDLQVLHPNLYKYLKEGEENNENTGYLVKNRKVWYKQEDREPAPFLCTYMARGKKESTENPFRFFYNKSKAIVTNNYLMLYPKPELKMLLDADTSLYEKVYEELNRISEKHFTNNGREYGGGLKKMEPRELKNLPIDDLINHLNQV